MGDLPRTRLPHRRAQRHRLEGGQRQKADLPMRSGEHHGWVAYSAC